MHWNFKCNKDLNFAGKSKMGIIWKEEYKARGYYEKHQNLWVSAKSKLSKS